MTERFLLDTCAIIWMVNDKAISQAAEARLNQTPPQGDDLCVSAMSAWEIGMLVSKRRLQTTKTAIAWFDEFIRRLNVEVLPATPEVLIASSYLPIPIHNDPTDRILIATAREHDLTIITRDRAILDYGAAGHVRTLAC